MQVSAVRCPSNPKQRGSGAGVVWDEVVREGFSEEAALGQKWGVGHKAIWVR